jgi:2-polyprenyl-3-methyl-5-hydroxy-6-metoxy-1,4-benzoquinol methylase
LSGSLLHHIKARLSIPAQYITSAPHPQNAVDLFKGEWWTSFPPPFTQVRAGSIDLWKDPRIAWAIGQFDPLEHGNVLELGPLEGAHSYMLEQAGFVSITAVEANPRAYLKCLTFKETLKLTKTSFLCGDFVEYLKSSPDRFDFVIGSGVLYHMINPVELIDLISRKANAVFLWTHYYSAEALRSNKKLSARLSGMYEAEYAGFRYRQFRYAYRGSFRRPEFCGGPRAHSHWLPREDILNALRFFGFADVVTGFETPEHPDGPAFALIAKRSRGV